MSTSRRLGRFFVHLYPHDNYLGRFEVLRAAQEGCAVVRCEYLGYMDGYEVFAEHPEFDPVDRDHGVPLYLPIFDDPDGIQPRRIRFDRVKD
jgi:hypothetical protein